MGSNGEIFKKSGLKSMVDCQKSREYNSIRMIVSRHLCHSQDAVNRAIPQDGGGGVDPVAEGGGEPPRIVSLNFGLQRTVPK